MDTEARLEELLQAATAGTYVPEESIRYTPTDLSLEVLSDRVREAPLVTNWGNLADCYRLPSQGFWAQYVERYRRQLSILQTFSASDVDRRVQIYNLTRHLMAMEWLGENCRLVDSMPLCVKPSLSKEVKEHFEADQVVVVGAGVSVRHLNRELAQKNQCLPFPRSQDIKGKLSRGEQGLSLGESIGLNLPHGLEAQCGNWRDWIVGMTVMLADGSVVKSGSRVVKNVAGYDAHKLFIGSRGTLGIILEVTLRTLPLQSLPTSEVVELPASQTAGHFKRARQELWIQRTMPSDFKAVVESAGEKLIEKDPASSTIWAAVPSDECLQRFSGDWVIRTNSGTKNLALDDPTRVRLMQQAKAVFDPTNKLNPGELGVV